MKSDKEFYRKALEEHKNIMKTARAGEVARSRDLYEALREV
jgi:hypothetical protein